MHKRSPYRAFRSILVKIAALIALTGLAVGVTVAVLSNRAAEALVRDGTGLNAAQTAGLMSASLADAIRLGNVGIFESAANDVIARSAGGIAGIAIADQSGKIIHATGLVGPVVTNLAARAAQNATPVRSPDGLVRAEPVYGQDGRAIGAVGLIGDPGPALALLDQGGKRVFVISAIVLIAATALSVQMLIRLLSLPLGDVRRAVRDLVAQNFETELNFADRMDELGSVARDVVKLRDTLAIAAGDQQMLLYQSAAFNDASIPMIMIDADARVIGANDQWHAMLETNREVLEERWPIMYEASIIGQSIDIFHLNPEHQRRMLFDETQMPFHGDITIGGQKIHMYVQMIKDAAGNHAGNILKLRDVSEDRLNKGILAALRQSQCVISYDLNGHILDLNDRAATSCAGEKSQFLGQHFAAVFGECDDMARAWTEALSGQPVALKMRRNRQDGAGIWVDATLNPVLDSSGALYRIVEISNDVTAVEDERQSAEDERVRIQAAQYRVVTDLRAGIARLATGDLTEEIAEPFAKEYDQLRVDFNAALGQLRRTMTDLVDVSHNIRSGSTELTQGSDELSRRTEIQAATLEETAAALQQITVSVQTSAEGAQEADQAVQTARSNATNGGEVVVEAIGAMKDIETSSRQISRIISVIDDIAFQTNLLALNAGVEAARAGDAGRGFAVVASEVRALAQRSSAAAKEIKDLISASSDQVKCGVGLVGRTGEALDMIVKSVEHISELVSEIARSSREQSNGLSEINAGVTQLDDVTQKNAAMVEQSTAASHAMRAEAEKLSDLTGAFKTGAPDRLPAADLLPESRKRKVTQAAGVVRPPEEPDRERRAVGWEDF